MKGLRGLAFSGSSRCVVKTLQNNSHSRCQADLLQVSADEVTVYSKTRYWR